VKLKNASVKCAPTCCDAAPKAKHKPSPVALVRCKATESVKATADHKTATRKKEMRFSVVEASECRQVGFCVGGKMRDLNPPGKLLSVNCDNTTMNCETMAVRFPGYEKLSVSVRKDHVLVVGENLKATAERVTAGDDGSLTFEGDVSVLSEGSAVDVKGAKVRVKLRARTGQTGVLSNPALIQD
jgi:hypothetical protein